MLSPVKVGSLRGVCSPPAESKIAGGDRVPTSMFQSALLRLFIKVI
jgi:hypothetical protein